MLRSCPFWYCSQYPLSLNNLRSILALARFMGGSDMQYSLDFEIRNHLAAYLAGEISLHDFEDWFFSKTWNVDQMNDPALIDLVYEIKLNWAEFSDGDWTEEELRSMLRPLVEKYKVTSSPIQIVSSTSNTNFQFSSSTIHSVLFVDTRSSRGYV